MEVLILVFLMILKDSCRERGCQLGFFDLKRESNFNTTESERVVFRNFLSTNRYLYPKIYKSFFYIYYILYKPLL